MTIIEYNGEKNILVSFGNGITVRSQFRYFISGGIKSPYDASIYGTAYLGEGDYKSFINGKTTLQYRQWHSMLDRCYSEKYHERATSYKECNVCEEWLNFQNFAKWYDENYYEVENEKMALDKDILHKGNKVYSPDTCMFVPQRINSLFVKRDISRGSCPIGVHFEKSRNKFKSVCGNSHNKTKNLGRFDTELEAFNAYKSFKEKTIREVANQYENKIPVNLYNAMMNYEVEITD